MKSYVFYAVYANVGNEFPRLVKLGKSARTSKGVTARKVTSHLNAMILFRLAPLWKRRNRLTVLSVLSTRSWKLRISMGSHSDFLQRAGSPWLAIPLPSVESGAEGEREREIKFFWTFGQERTWGVAFVYEFCFHCSLLVYIEFNELYWRNSD